MWSSLDLVVGKHPTYAESWLKGEKNVPIYFPWGRYREISSKSESYQMIRWNDKQIGMELFLCIFKNIYIQVVCWGCGKNTLHATGWNWVWHSYVQPFSSLNFSCSFSSDSYSKTFVEFTAFDKWICFLLDRMASTSFTHPPPTKQNWTDEASYIQQPENTHTQNCRER